MDNLVLIGFAKLELTDLIEKIGTLEGEEYLLSLISNKPPVYREQRACSEEQVLAFAEYVGWLQALLNNYEEKKNE